MHQVHTSIWLNLHVCLFVCLSTYLSGQFPSTARASLDLFFFFKKIFKWWGPTQAKGGTGGEGPGQGKFNGCIMHQVHTSDIEGTNVNANNNLLLFWL